MRREGLQEVWEEGGAERRGMECQHPGADEGERSVACHVGPCSRANDRGLGLAPEVGARASARWGNAVEENVSPIQESAWPGKGKRHSVAYRMRMLVTRLWDNWKRLTLYQRRGDLDGTNNTTERLIGWWIKTLSHDARIPQGGVDQERCLPDHLDGRQVRPLRYGGAIRLKERLGQEPLPLPPNPFPYSERSQIPPPFDRIGELPTMH